MRRLGLSSTCDQQGLAATGASSPSKAAPRDLLIVLHPQTMSAAVAVVGPRP